MLDRRLARLEQIVNIDRLEEQEKVQKAADLLWKQTLERFSAALPNDLQDRVGAALRDEDCPLWPWIENLFRGRSRLPERLTEDVMRQLVLIRLDQADRCDSFEAVCLGCGLQYPMHKTPPMSEWKVLPGKKPLEGEPPWYDLPHFFEHDGCPACGASSRAEEMNWAHLISDGYWFGR
jgi:hypothetical protein